MVANGAASSAPAPVARKSTARPPPVLCGQPATISARGAAPLVLRTTETDAPICSPATPVTVANGAGATPPAARPA